MLKWAIKKEVVQGRLIWL